MTAVVQKPLCQVWLIVALLLSALSCADRSQKIAARKSHFARAPFQEEKKFGDRKIYPLSVIYGGAYSSEELSRSRRLDSVVKTHYADFGKDPVMQRNPKDLFVYVSYRRSDKVYWTTTKQRIPAGELLLSDGKNLARARCGNRLSFTPQQPVVPGKEASEDALNTPETPKVNAPFEAPAVPLLETDLYVPDSSLLSNVSSASPGPFAAPSGTASGNGSTPGNGSGGALGPMVQPGGTVGILGTPQRLATTDSLPAVGGNGGSIAPLREPASLITPEPSVISLLAMMGVTFLLYALGRRMVIRQRSS